VNHLLVLMLTLAAMQAVAGPADFARGRVVEGDGESSAQRITLPADVYEWVTRPDLGDLRVFNDAQEEVPYAIRRPQSRNEFGPWQQVPVFALPETESADGANTRINVEVDDLGAIIAVNGSRVGDSSLATFLVDASSLEQASAEMQIEWDHSAGDFVSRLRIEASDDLDDWKTLVDATTIASLSDGAHDVLLDRIELPRRKSRYLRLTQLTGSERIELSGIRLRYRESLLPERVWKEVSGTPADGGFEFESGGLFPVDRVSVTTGQESNYFLAVTLFSRASPEQRWSPRGQRLFYRSTVNGVDVTSDPVSIRTPDQYWRVVVDGDPGLEPVLRIGWLPDELVFLHQGSGPFLMAYGAAGLEGRQWPLQQLLQKLSTDGRKVDIADLGIAATADPELLGGPERLLAAAEPIDWQTIVLWAVLLIGVVVVGGFAYRLLKSPAKH